MSTTPAIPTGTRQPQTASIGRRAAARLVDSVAITAVAFPTGVAASFGPVWFAATLAGSLLWFVGGDVTGATLGKRLLGLRVTDHATGARPTIGQAARREVLVAASAIPFIGPIAAAVGWVAAAVTASRHEHRRGWHDRFAGTAVTLRATRSV